MKWNTRAPEIAEAGSPRADALYREAMTRIQVYTDRMFVCLMPLQWIGGVVAALCLSPLTWDGARCAIHPHVWAALVLGGGIALLPVMIALRYPGRAVTRLAIAVCQMLMSALLIHVTGGRIETHFHVFGSLAFLAFYRDWRVLIAATVVVAGDHMLRGLYWPQSVFGVAAVSPWRWVEHAAWVVFEDVFLLLATAQSLREMRTTVQRQARLEETEASLSEARHGLERQVEARTAELSRTNVSLQEQIAERERAQEIIEWQAYHDTLTGLPNRALFQDRLEQALALAERQGCSAAVLFLDMDRFKQVNDTLGHSAGDRLLLEMAGRLKNSLPAECTLARMGGDEFTVLLPSLGHTEDAAKVAHRLLDAFAPPLRLEGEDLHLSVSVGISIFPSDGADGDTLLRNADAAMYRVKEQGGGGCQLYAEEMNAAARERLLLESSLRRALTQNELVLYYQPQVDIVTGRIRGVEALVRWQHPDLGLVPPTKFIPLAEETGLILPLGNWVLQEAARQAAAWRREGFEVQVAINVSARQFEKRDWPETVAGVLNETGLPADCLELELTEGVIMARGEAVIESLLTLKGLGLRLSVDDFGTGYSSLSYLRRFPLDTLKIDRAFIRGLGADEVDAAIVRAVVDLAHAVNLEVVAEGVETDGQWQVLKRLGCDTLQGYLFSRPLPAAAMGALLRQDASLCDEFSLLRAA